MNLLKIGNRLINLDQIDLISLGSGSGSDATVTIKFISLDHIDHFLGPEAEAIRSFFCGESGRFIRPGVWEIEIPVQGE